MQLANTFTLTKKKPYAILAILLLLFLATGCVNKVEQKANRKTCGEAEAVVNKAQEQYDAIMHKLAKKPTDEDKNNKETFMEKLQDAQEEAFDICEGG
ncbi:MAG TPA: hypothetical protein DDZ80_06275 [Cyanobacteria bacterium UBA8803]|nr:hypothetical protein [Cyanobacteria bacterium UBA9273]HBL58140.1 hypothetical protein [Cyanobacteria bacterium UBA8803]